MECEVVVADPPLYMDMLTWFGVGLVCGAFIVAVVMLILSVVVDVKASQCSARGLR